MSFKSIIQDMRGELGSISRKGFDVKFGYGFRSRSHRVVQDSSVVIDALKQSCWANMPPELLRDVLMRIEASELTWPPRKNVVACAGVCRSWRENMKEIVKTLEVSGKLTFPISLKQPGPRDSLIQCFIKRDRSTQAYLLYLSLNQTSSEDGKLLLAARKCRRPTYTDYIISLNPEDVSKGSSTYIGKLRSNFLGTKFTIYDSQPPNAEAKVTKSRSTRRIGMRRVSPKFPAGNYTVAHISYELNVLGSRGPRRMHCVMDAIPASAVKPGGVAPTQTEFMLSSMDSFPSLPFFRSKSTRMENFQSGPLSSQKDGDGMLVLKNKSPRWHEQLQCWCLNFNGRVTVASVKNFQLVASVEDGAAGQQEHENVILQFGKVGKDVFTMDYQYPISAFQAFAICLSSFDTKIACE
ncbi:tubby-like F-box protein 3 [Rhododendron vialii]|uniref:tubby-like F-box protein 3 n=1 Tax=Rhododendron vialii TaxID=182163 RepID=UPI00265F5078|nr:tubby-like F-box protein 3 [Rhododendron vialii]